MTFNICLAGAMAAALVLCGCATTTPNAALRMPAYAAGNADPNCLTDTGSRIAGSKTTCRGYGRSYTEEDVSRTGQTSAADALRQLDPSISVHR